MGANVLQGSWMALIVAISPIYDALNHDTGSVHSLVTRLDRSIPFIPQFVVPYVAWYGYILVMLVWLLYRDAGLYEETLAAIVLGMLASCTVYSVFQTYVPRPAVVGQDIFSKLTKRIYRHDNPFNAFPSIHVLTSYILFLTADIIKSTAPLPGIAAQCVSVSIIFSTLFLKQHVVADVVGGMLLARFCLEAVRSLFRGKDSEHSDPVGGSLRSNCMKIVSFGV